MAWVFDGGELGSTDRWIIFSQVGMATTVIGPNRLTANDNSEVSQEIEYLIAA